MELNKNIYHLRKEKGLSQEGLAEQIKVSRQTISIWELGQTYPNPEQLILLSKILNTSIDELVGNEIEKNSKNTIDTRIFATCGTALNFIGLVLSIIIWKEEQTSIAVAIGLILMAMGCMIFMIGKFIGKENKNISYFFILFNIWFLSLIPISCIFNLIQAIINSFSYWTISPLPELGNSYIAYGVCWFTYFMFCGIVDSIIISKL